MENARDRLRVSCSANWANGPITFMWAISHAFLSTLGIELMALNFPAITYPKIDSEQS